MAEYQMTALLVFIVFLILALGEALRHNGRIKGEYARKFDHILVGTFVAFWPFLITNRSILIVAGLALGMTFAMRRLQWLRKTFRSIYSVRRKSYGDYFFPLSVALSAVLFHDSLIFCGAVLVSALSDGLAAVIGKTFGRHGLSMVKKNKTIEGSLAFLVVTVVVLSVVLSLRGLNGLGLSLIVVFAAWILTILEAMMSKGWDNLVLPLIAGAMITMIVSLS